MHVMSHQILLHVCNQTWTTQIPPDSPCTTCKKNIFHQSTTSQQNTTSIKKQLLHIQITHIISHTESPTSITPIAKFSKKTKTSMILHSIRQGWWRWNTHGAHTIVIHHCWKVGSFHLGKPVFFGWIYRIHHIHLLRRRNNNDGNDDDNNNDNNHHHRNKSMYIYTKRYKECVSIPLQLIQSPVPMTFAEKCCCHPVTLSANFYTGTCQGKSGPMNGWMALGCTTFPGKFV